jgi:hypothetical protein
MVKNKVFLCKKECKITKNSVKTTFSSRIFSAKKLIFNEKHRLNAIFLIAGQKKRDKKQKNLITPN